MSEIKRWVAKQPAQYLPYGDVDISGEETVVSAQDHDRIVAELRDRLGSYSDQEKFHESDLRKKDKTIATQKRVIDTLRSQRNEYIVRCGYNETSHFWKYCDAEIDAIERGEG